MGLGEDRDLVPLGAGFDIMKRGYSRVQVEEHLERLDGELRLLAADRDAAVSQAADLARQLEQSRSEIDNLRGQVERLALPPTTLEGLSERLQRMLRLAQDEAAETKARAEAEAEHIRAKGEADANSLRQQFEQKLAELENRKAQMESEHRTLIDTSRKEIADSSAAAEAERNRLDSESEQRRTTVEEDFEIAMASRRTESMRALAEQEATSKSEAERRVREATEEANRRRHESITEANARLHEASYEAHRRVREATEEANRRITHAAERVTVLRRLRARVADQLHSARDLLAEAHEQLENAVPVLDPLPEEIPAVATSSASSSSAPSSSASSSSAPSSSAPGKPAADDVDGPTKSMRPIGAPKEGWEPAAVDELDKEPQQRRSSDPKADAPTVRTSAQPAQQPSPGKPRPRPSAQQPTKQASPVQPQSSAERTG
jgi:cell division septum initiation protein DivIVA